MLYKYFETKIRKEIKNTEHVDCYAYLLPYVLFINILMV